MKRILRNSAAAFGVAVLGTAAVADLPNDRWSYDDPVVTGGEWELTGESYMQGQATFVEWERTTTTTQEALNPAGHSVGTDRFDKVDVDSESTYRNINAGPPPD